MHAQFCIVFTVLAIVDLLSLHTTLFIPHCILYIKCVNDLNMYSLHVSSAGSSFWLV